jgi:hypothetical protein
MHVSLDSALGRQRRLNQIGETINSIATPAAAFSLRSLTGGDPLAVRVRRESDNFEKDFTVSGIASGALENFCDEATPARNRTGGAKYSSFSASGVTGFSASTSNAAACGYDIFGASGTAVQVSFDIVLNSGSVSVKLRPEFETGSDVSNSESISSSGSKSFTLTSTAEFKALQFIAASADFVVSNFLVNVPYNHSAFVHTWFDQSGNDRHSIQDTDARQPIIVESGTFQNGLKFTHADTTNGKRLSFDRDTSQLGTEFAFVWVGTYSGSSSTPKNILGASRLVQGFNSGSMGLVVRPSVENFRFRNENSSTTNQQIVSTQTMSADTLGVVFANYDDDAVTISLNGTANTATFSSTVLNSTKNFHIMSVTPYATANSPEGICREALVYDTNQVNNRTSIETNIINHYSIS